MLILLWDAESAGKVIMCLPQEPLCEECINKAWRGMHVVMESEVMQKTDTKGHLSGSIS